MRSTRSDRSRAALFAAPAACLMLHAAALASARQEPESANEDRAQITAAELEAHVRFLASDAMQGRDTGSPQLVEAARYIATYLAQAGVAPAGDEGGFLQSVPLSRALRDADPTLTLVAADGTTTSAASGSDFLVLDGDRSTGRLRVLHVRSAEDLPEQSDAEVALYLDAAGSEGEAWLAARGLGDGSGFGALVMRGSSREGRVRSRPRAGGLEIGDGSGAGPLRLRANGTLRERFEQGSIAAIELAQSVRRETLPAFNVVGRIEGVGTPERPELARETIVFTAHYDHIGTKPAPASPTPETTGEAGEAGDAGAGADAGEAPDLIYNGADDDASGTACVLELAERFAADRPPARTLVFLLATGEERGLLGTFYYLDHPVVPLEQTVCNLNFEMIGRPDAQAGGPGRLWLTGHERSNLFDAILSHEIPISPDLRTEQNFFSRSDNIAFAMRDIVAQTLSSYDLHQDYHQVSDEADALDYAHMEQGARAAYDIARLLADGAIDPAWLPGGSPAKR